MHHPACTDTQPIRNRTTCDRGYRNVDSQPIPSARSVPCCLSRDCVAVCAVCLYVPWKRDSRQAFITSSLSCLYRGKSGRENESKCPVPDSVDECGRSPNEKGTAHGRGKSRTTADSNRIAPVVLGLPVYELCVRLPLYWWLSSFLLRALSRARLQACTR